MMKVKKSEIPADSLTVKYFPADYKDSFRVISSENISIAPDDLMVRLDGYAGVGECSFQVA